MSYFPEVVDNTMRSAWRKCEQKFKYAHVDNLVPVEVNWHLHAGKAYAAGIERARKAFYIEGKSAHTAIAEGVVAVKKEWGYYEPPKSLFVFKTLDRMMGAVEYYFSVWPLGEDGFHPAIAEGNRMMIEEGALFDIPVIHPITGKNLKYSIRMDFLGVDEHNGGIVAIDEKTAGKFSDDWAMQWDFDSQITGYIWGSQKIMQAPVTGLIRAVSILKNDYGNIPVRIQRPQWQIDRWYTQMVRDFQRAVTAYKEGIFAYDLDDACKAFGRPCDFAPLCNATNPERLIDGNYNVSIWHPDTRERT